MSDFIKTSVTLTKNDKQFLESNSISVSKFLRQSISDKRKGQTAIRQDQTARPAKPPKGDSI